MQVLLKAGTNDQNTITDQQVGPVAIELARVQSAAANAESDLKLARAQARSGHLDTVSGVLDSATIVDLRRQRTEVSRLLGEIEGRYGPRHPETARVNDQLKQIDSQLREESNRVLRSLQAKADSTKAQVAILSGRMQELENDQAKNARASVIASSLQRDAESKRTAYDRMAELAFDTRQASQNAIAQAQVIDAAEPAQEPYWPNRPLLFLLSLLVGAGVGVATVTAQELMVTGMRDIDEIESELGVPLLGAIPAMRKNARPADLLIDKPTSQYSEALRNARASIMGVKSGSRPKILAVTSALPAEGKTTSALSLARTMAINGEHTVIVDVDVRRAQLRQIVGDSGTGPGTVELLHGEARLDEVIETTELENLDQIVVKKPYFSSENLFGNDSMPGILEELSAKYDVIILDLPPLLGLADGRFLAALADAVVLVVKWDATPAHAVKTALASLNADGSNVIGALYSMVDSGSEAVGTYYYYSKKYSAYYADET